MIYLSEKRRKRKELMETTRNGIFADTTTD